MQLLNTESDKLLFAYTCRMGKRLGKRKVSRVFHEKELASVEVAQS